MFTNLLSKDSNYKYINIYNIIMINAANLVETETTKPMDEEARRIKENWTTEVEGKSREITDMRLKGARPTDTEYLRLLTELAEAKTNYEKYVGEPFPEGKGAHTIPSKVCCSPEGSTEINWAEEQQQQAEWGNKYGTDCWVCSNILGKEKDGSGGMIMKPRVSECRCIGCNGCPRFDISASSAAPVFSAAVRPHEEVRLRHWFHRATCGEVMGESKLCNKCLIAGGGLNPSSRMLPDAGYATVAEQARASAGHNEDAKQMRAAAARFLADQKAGPPRAATPMSNVRRLSTRNPVSDTPIPKEEEQWVKLYDSEGIAFEHNVYTGERRYVEEYEQEPGWSLLESLSEAEPEAESERKEDLLDWFPHKTKYQSESEKAHLNKFYDGLHISPRRQAALDVAQVYGVVHQYRKKGQNINDIPTEEIEQAVEKVALAKKEKTERRGMPEPAEGGGSRKTNKKPTKRRKKKLKKSRRKKRKTKKSKSRRH